MIEFESKGSFDKTENFLNKLIKGNLFRSLERYGAEGVRALAAATPKDTEETANGWYYTIFDKNGAYQIIWRNRHVVDNNIIAILIQYGHGTGTGGYIPGRDYINPTMKPIFDRMATDGWKVVTSA